MMDRKQYEALYEEYKQIDDEISYVFQPRNVVRGQRRDMRTAPSVEKMLRHKELAKILIKNGNEFLKLDPGEWYDITLNAQDS